MSSIFAQYDNTFFPSSANNHNNNKINPVLSRQTSAETIYTQSQLLQPYDPYSDPYFNQPPPLPPLPQVERKEEIIESLVNYLQSNFEVIDTQLNQQLELVENVYIFEVKEKSAAGQEQGSPSSSSIQRKSIEALFNKLENIKKQLIFLYLYCDLSEGQSSQQEIQQHLLPIVQSSSASSPQAAEGQDSLDSRQNISQNKLLALIQDILNDPIPHGVQEIAAQNHYEAANKRNPSTHSISSTFSTQSVMKRRLSLLRQEETTPAFFPTLEEQRSSFRNEEENNSNNNNNTNNQQEQMRRSSLSQMKLEEPTTTTTTTSTSTMTRKKSLVINEQNNQSHPPPPPQQSQEGQQAGQSKAASIHARLFNENELSVPEEKLEPPSMDVSASVRAALQANDYNNTISNSTSNLSSPSGQSKFTTDKMLSPAAADMKNRRKSVLQSVGSNASLLTQTTMSTPTTTKIPGLVVGRKNSLVLVDNKVSNDFRVRKQSLYRSPTTSGEEGASPAGTDNRSYYSGPPMTTDELNGNNNFGIMKTVSSGDYYDEEESSSSQRKPFQEMKNNNFDGQEGNPNKVPFTSHSSYQSMDSLPPPPPPPLSSLPSSNTLISQTTTGSNSSPLKFIHGKVVPSNNNNNNRTQADTLAAPKLAMTPLEKANDFINRVKMLDSVYLTRNNSSYNPNSLVSATADDLNNGGVSYLHNNTFTGTIYRSETKSKNSPGDSSANSSKKNLTNALTSFMQVIEKCNDTSSRAKLLVNQMEGRSSRSTSPNTSASSPRFMTHTHSYSGKLSPTSEQKRSHYHEARIRNLANTFQQQSSSPTHSRSPTRNRPMSSTVLSGEVHRKIVSQTTNQVNIQGRSYHNFYDNNEPNNLSNSFQSLYNLNNNSMRSPVNNNNVMTTTTTTTMTSNASVNSKVSSISGGGLGNSPGGVYRGRSKSPRTRYSIHQEHLSTKKSPVAFSFSPKASKR
jgi:hypothetical protein